MRGSGDHPCACACVCALRRAASGAHRYARRGGAVSGVGPAPSSGGTACRVYPEYPLRVPRVPPVSARSSRCAYAARKRSCRPVIADTKAFPAEPSTGALTQRACAMAAFDRRALSAQSQVRRTNDIPHEVHSSSPGHANGRAATASADNAVPHPASGLQRRGARTAAKGALCTLCTREGALDTREYALCVRRVCLPTALYAGGRARSVLSRLRVLTAHTARVPAVPRECRVSTVGGAAVKNHESSNSHSLVAL